MSDRARPKTILRTFKSTVDDVDKAKRTIRSIVTTDAIDRYNEVILPKGIALKNYLGNPVVLWMHRSDQPIARCLEIKRKGNGLVALTEFAETDRAVEIFELYADGFLNGWSIGARPDWRTCGAPTPEEIKERPELKGCWNVIRRCELIEYSAVSIPANPECLGNEVAKGLSGDLYKDIALGERWTSERPPGEADAEFERHLEDQAAELPPLVGRSFGEALTDMREQIRRMTGGVTVQRMAQDAIDRIKGQV